MTLANALLAALILRMMLVAGVDRRRLWGWACAPPLVLYVGHNWDMAAATLAVAALLLARANRLVQAATAAALGTAAKLFPVLALPLIGLTALSKGRWRERLVRATLVSAAAIGAWLLVNLPVALLAPDNWSEFYRFSQERSGTAAASWDALSNLGWLLIGNDDRNRYAATLFVAGAAAIVALGWRRHGDRPWILFTPVLAWFLLTNKVYSPQFDLWLYPLLLLTAPRLVPVALFAAGDIAAYFAEFWLLGSMEHGWPTATFAHVAIAAGFRAAAMLWLIADCVLRDAPGWIVKGDTGLTLSRPGQSGER
ncbi:glycosyltransferase 87 family protein [Sphingomonas sp. MMS12-HWE2-04]|uniref:glycosyltransferase 87 family protein n=1 Tax=Sphingomonas sp. MMS12-HWE2-04 TaxID=3234199 RepID=UPI0038500AF4